MAVWVVRQDSPKSGEWNEFAVANEVADIDFWLQTNIDRSPHRQALEHHLLHNAPDAYGYRFAPTGRVRIGSTQVWDFYKRIELGDIAIYQVWEDGVMVAKSFFKSAT